MNQFKYILFSFLFISQLFFSQEKITISGTVYDNLTNETLIGVSIYFPEIKSGTSTNEYGFYSITIPKGEYKVQISSLGYQTIFKTINLSEKITKDFKLIEESESLDEIIIEADIEKLNVKTPQMSVNKLTATTIKQIPVVLGESDIIKSIILLSINKFCPSDFFNFIIYLLKNFIESIKLVGSAWFFLIMSLPVP